MKTRLIVDVAGTADKQPSYSLNIDGPQFRAQRALLLKLLARTQRLGSLFNEADYPGSLCTAFGVQWDFPGVEPPDYLRQLNPDLYEHECQRIQDRFSEAVRLAEEAFTTELAKLVSHLTERLSGQEDGRAKIFRLCGTPHKRNYAEARIMCCTACEVADCGLDCRCRPPFLRPSTVHNPGALPHASCQVF